MRKKRKGSEMKRLVIVLALVFPLCVSAEEVLEKISVGLGGGLFKNAMMFDYMVIGKSYSGELKYGITKDLEIGFWGGYGVTYAANNLDAGSPDSVGGVFRRTRVVVGDSVFTYPYHEARLWGTPYALGKSRAGFIFDRSKLFNWKYSYTTLALFVQFRSMTRSIFNPLILAGIERYNYKLTDDNGHIIQGLSTSSQDTTWKDIKNSHWGLLTRIGFEIFPAENVGIQAGAVAHFPFTDPFTKEYMDSLVSSAGLEAKLTFYYGGVKDSDKDGVINKIDRCPDTPFGAIVDEYGCPMDSDGDGVFDGLDKCPNTIYGAVVDLTGCAVDSDQDGVPDGIDRCVNTPKGARVDSLGCPIDQDKDGVPDFKDRCPNTPVGAIVDSVGCPFDSDGDGVYDGIDECPNSPQGSVVARNGCPPSKVDTDGDGITDDIDRCPDTPRGVQVDSLGCPLDLDWDTVPDYKDKCPKTPRGAIVDTVGCPLDGDKDGVYDGLDRCPNTPPGVEVDSVGCPIVKELKKGESISITVHFESCEWTVTEQAAKDLEIGLQLLKAYPEMRVVIEGHTDDRPPVGECARRVKNNTELSILRAKAVKDWYVKQGIDPSRMETIGYGETRPRDTNQTPEGRANNRRIEIRRIE
jgi:outer membrane protein OmpA-like peptidoglycan-associated protein